MRTAVRQRTTSTLLEAGWTVFDIELLGPPEGQGEDLFNWGRLTLGHFERSSRLRSWIGPPAITLPTGWNRLSAC